MNNQTPDDATIEVVLAATLAATLAAIHSGKIPLPENNPQIAALRDRVAELEAQAKGHADECEVGIKLRDSVASALRDATIEAMDLRLEIAELEMERAVLRAQLAVLASRAKFHAEALVIAHGVGAASRNDEVRALKTENDIPQSAEEAGCTASRNKCMDELAQMLGIDANPLSDEHITGAVDELLAQRNDALGAMAAQDEREKVAGEMCGVLHHLHGCDWPDAVAERVVSLEEKILAIADRCPLKAEKLLAVAQAYVWEVVEENADKWGERRMYKQQPAIDCDAAITAFLEGK